jgi:hypothetical protein
VKNPDSDQRSHHLHKEVLRRVRRAILIAHLAHDTALVLALARHARALYSALKGMSPADRLALAARSQLAVCNLSEFAEMAVAAGIECPDDEQTANLETVAAALRTFQSRVTSGNLALTLGQRGVIAANGYGGAVGHISIRLTPAQRERIAFLKAAPSRGSPLLRRSRRQILAD